MKANSTIRFCIENSVCAAYKPLYIYMHKNSYYQVYNDEF